MAGVGTRKTFEDERVIVWDLDLDPGEAVGRHTHVWNYFVRIISGSTLEAFDGEGKSLGTVELESGATMYFRVQGDKVCVGSTGISGRASDPQCPKYRFEAVSGSSGGVQEVGSGLGWGLPDKSPKLKRFIQCRPTCP